MPDVVAWDDLNPIESALFVECKGPSEAVREAQEDAPDRLLAGVAELEVADHIPAAGEDVLLDAGRGLLCV